MLERNCAALDEGCAIGVDISARILFSGALAAQCAVEFPSNSAERLTSAFLGPCQDGCKIHWEDSMVADAVGELCNMIAGGWKTRLGEPAWQAHLSVPLILRGPPAGPESDPHAVRLRLRRAYLFDESPFVVSLTMP